MNGQARLGELAQLLAAPAAGRAEIVSGAGHRGFDDPGLAGVGQQCSRGDLDIAGTPPPALLHHPNTRRLALQTLGAGAGEVIGIEHLAGDAHAPGHDVRKYEGRARRQRNRRPSADQNSVA